MTTREGILASLRFQDVRSVVWAPRWDLWFTAASDGRLPSRYQGWHIHDVARDLGMGIKGYGVRPFVEEGLPISGSSRAGIGETVQEYETPFGVLRRVEKQTAELASAGVRGRVVKEFIVERQDYDPAIWLVENTRIVPRHEEVAAEMARIGEDGVLLAFLGHAPAHLVMREFTGYEGFYYQMQDNPDKLEQLIEALGERQREVERVGAESPAEVVEFDGNYDAFLTPPPIYRQFFLPWHQRLVEACHRAGKMVATHTDGHNDGLVELILESGFDVAEAFTPPPMTNIGIGKARRVWGERMAIWGGLAATAFTLRYSDEEFAAHVTNALTEAGSGRGFVLGTGDNIPTDAPFHRVRWVAELVRDWNESH